jgi:hypothetical protein
MLMETQDEQTVLVTRYVMIDDLLKAFGKQFGQRPMLPGKASCGRPSGLTVSEWITLGVFRYALQVKDMKHFWRHIYSHYHKDFPGLPNYQNFVAGVNRTTPYVILLLQWLLYKNREQAKDPFFVDATSLKVCENWRISSHKVCQDIARMGKTTLGWFFGFKLHMVVDELGNMLSILITPGNTDDRKFLLKLFRGLKGIAVGDAGYVSEKAFKELLKQGTHLFTAMKKNMKRVASASQDGLLTMRQRIEISFSTLKYRLQQAVTVARSVGGYFSRWLYACLSYNLFRMAEPLKLSPITLN